MSTRTPLPPLPNGDVLVDVGYYDDGLALVRADTKCIKCGFDRRIAMPLPLLLEFEAAISVVDRITNIAIKSPSIPTKK